MSTVLETFKERCKGRDTRLVFPEGEDERIVQAAAILATEGITTPILLGDRSTVDRIADEHDVSLTDLEVIQPKTTDERNRYVSAYQEVRSVSEETAEKIVGNELIFGGLSVRLGDADGMIGGCVRTSDELISASKEVIGLRENVQIPSSFFIMELPNEDVFFFADSALNENPTAEELADIAVTTSRSATALMNWEPLVALLSFSTKGSASHPDVQKVQRATAVAQKREPDLSIDGELQADAALDEAIAERKLREDTGAVAGKANTLVFPDLDAGNIAYKLVQELAGGNAYGPILQGFDKPVSDLSRGASVGDIVGVAAITASLVDGGVRS